MGRTDKTGIALGGFIILLSMAATVVFIWIAVHFIHKLW